MGQLCPAQQKVRLILFELKNIRAWGIRPGYLITAHLSENQTTVRIAAEHSLQWENASQAWSFIELGYLGTDGKPVYHKRPVEGVSYTGCPVRKERFSDPSYVAPEL